MVIVEMDQGAQRANDLMDRERESYDRKRIIKQLDEIASLLRELLNRLPEREAET